MGEEKIMLKEVCKLVHNDGMICLIYNNYNISLSYKEAIYLLLTNNLGSSKAAMEVIKKIKIFEHDDLVEFEEIMNRMYAKFFCIVTDLNKDSFIEYNVMEFLQGYSFDVLLDKTDVPRNILYHVTDKCDKSCKYCYIGAEHGVLEPDALTLEQVKKIIEEFSSMGGNSILYTGGEPFIRKDLLDIVEFASNKGICNDISTKHYLTIDEINKLKQIKNVEISLSYDIHIEEIAYKLIGIKDHAKRMDKNIQMLVENNIDLIIKPVVNKLTINYFEDFVEHLSSLGVKKISMGRFSCAENIDNSELYITDDEWYKVCSINNFKDVEITTIEKLDIGKEKIDDKIFCVNAKTCLPILHNGLAVLCDHMPQKEKFCFGDLREDSIYDIWNSDKRINYAYPSKKQFANTKCCKCDEFDTCATKMGCYKSTFEQTGTIYSPVQCQKNVSDEMA